MTCSHNLPDKLKLEFKREGRCGEFSMNLYDSVCEGLDLSNLDFSFQVSIPFSTLQHVVKQLAYMGELMEVSASGYSFAFSIPKSNMNVYGEARIELTQPEVEIRDCHMDLPPIFFHGTVARVCGHEINGRVGLDGVGWGYASQIERPCRHHR